MSKKVVITENELHDIISEAINNYMLNENTDEGFFKNLHKGFQAGKNTKIDYQKENPKDLGGMLHNSLSQRIAAAKQGFNLQKQYTKMDQLKQELQQLVDNGKINPKWTVERLLANFGALNQVKADSQRSAKKLGTHLDENV